MLRMPNFSSRCSVHHHLTATILSLYMPPSIQGHYQLRHAPFQQQDQALENHPCTRISCGPKRIYEAWSPLFCSVFESHSPQSHTLTQPPDQSYSQKAGSKEHFRSLTRALCPAPSNLGMRLERKLRQGIGWLTSSCVEGPVLAPKAGVCFQEALAKLHLCLAAL